MAEDTVEYDKKDFVGVADSYANAANETDVPRYADDEEREKYERFGTGPEPESATPFPAHEPKAGVNVEANDKRETEAEQKLEKSNEPSSPKTPSAPVSPSAPAAPTSK